MHHDVVPETQQTEAPQKPRSGAPWYVWFIRGIVVGMVAYASLAVAVVSLIRAFAVTAVTTEQTVTIPQQFLVTGVSTVIVHNITGTVSVVAGRDGMVRIQLTKRARDINAQQAQDDLNDIQVDFTEVTTLTSNTVSIDVQSPSGSNSRRQLSADVEVTVPVATTLNLLEVAGTVSASGVNLQGSSTVSLTTGNIILDNALASGASLDVRLVTGNATLTLPTQTAVHLDAATVTGNVQINGWSIPVTGTLTSQRASGDLSAQPTGTVTVRVTTGNIAVSAR